jgi:DNA-binding transcriptional ArsR family regulator
MVSHHLDVLEEQKLVESKYELTKIQGSKRGVAVRTCKITEKAEDALKDIRESSK